MGDATALLWLILILGTLVALAFLLSRYLFRKAIRDVVLLFREAGAVSPARATTMEQLGLVKKGALDRMFKMRDYRPYAVRMLGQANVLKTTEEGLVYLSEGELATSPVKDFARIP